ncbi:hypothetical protein CKO42_01900 [Lamprobacter modestohalophilus]|uniref:Uncharacterized protein n=1 Tax=Lamprobacter modestohalophilus TaxID=1064514 RepID=A0A9X1B350_9GAMM|nr:hypothetical protein [Lamprobacter modestohalophilus]MCF7976512.1 DUF6489 family protein [Chromatiaceae bacterium]MCF7994074.1 DUF6489 family protein [Chromatiaceae bacterium]MCF8015688.1 DUF6489 family protein [Chromatiaceae bacterium]
MKFQIDVEMTPAELRKLMGLPDLEALQQRMLDDIQARIEQGVEGYDPMELMQPYLKTSLAGMDMMQRLFAAGMGAAAAAGKKQTSGSGGD